MLLVYALSLRGHICVDFVWTVCVINLIKHEPKIATLATLCSFCARRSHVWPVSNGPVQSYKFDKQGSSIKIAAT